MHPLKRLSKAVRGASWVIRPSGLFERLARLEALAADDAARSHDLLGALDRGSEHRAEQLSALVKERSTDIVVRLEGLVARLDGVVARLDGVVERLDHHARDNQQSDRILIERLTAIGGVAQDGHDRAVEALRKAQQIDTLLRSRSRVFGHEMFLDPTDAIISPFLLRDGYFEPYETTLMEAAIKPGQVVLDIGANIGYYTLLFARLVGESGKVFAFEPDPANYELLRKNVRANGYHNVVFVRKAVADSSGPLSLYLCPDNKGDHRAFDSHDGRPSIPIEATSLDEYFDGYDGPIDFIKMDIQGSEGRALRGMKGLLAKHPDVKIITEFWPAGLHRSGVEARDYLADMERLGFRLHRIDDETETLELTTAEALLTQYPADREQFSNLYCARSA